jgi:cell division protein ZapA (FtsZ GTPase activity inhibitor)
MSVQIVNIDLLGTSFTVQTDESLDYMEGLIARLRERFASLSSQTRVADPLKLSILANITILDELLRERTLMTGDDSMGRNGLKASAASGSLSGASAPEEELARVTARLIADLDRSLDAPAP